MKFHLKKSLLITSIILMGLVVTGVVLLTRNATVTPVPSEKRLSWSAPISIIDANPPQSTAQMDCVMDGKGRIFAAWIAEKQDGAVPLSRWIDRNSPPTEVTRIGERTQSVQTHLSVVGNPAGYVSVMYVDATPGQEHLNQQSYSPEAGWYNRLNVPLNAKVYLLSQAMNSRGDTLFGWKHGDSGRFHTGICLAEGQCKSVTTFGPDPGNSLENLHQTDHP